ncbi:uncharacterized protein LOC103957011 [Pyrus x bretschneideri]|uniref:uncharacterized protein LOC103957011 n=1 Tax=Pyrus x bretschneideri TaxID=225117 RepID=UPI0005117AC8|nr:uncharacterized protein LOC103957011 [Pyrus x bretschneideri]
MATDEEEMECLSVTFEDSLDLEERLENNIHLVGRLITNNEPSEHMVKEVLHNAWNKMGDVKILKAKPNILAITVEEEAITRRLLEGNPWFIKDYTFSVKFWPSYHSLDDIKANRAIFWIRAHGVLRHFCTLKNAKCIGERLGDVLEVDNPLESGFRGFLRLKVDFDASKPLITQLKISCPKEGHRSIRFKYEGLRIFHYHCSRLEHASNYINPVPPLPSGGYRFPMELRTAPLSKASLFLFPSFKTSQVVSGKDDQHWRNK